MMNNLNRNRIRHSFALALSAMYQQEVPLYAKLLRLVSDVNSSSTNSKPLSNPTQERHGAIRLGKASELFNMRRLFALMNMFPVAYYDLSASGLPVHSTAFRPINTSDLEVNPLRLFTSLLRLDLISDKPLQDKAQLALDKRTLFNSEMMKLIDLGESTDAFNDHQTDRFIKLAIDLFKWHDCAAIEYSLYQSLKIAHPLIADIVSFKGPHINHLTPATLDIDQVQYKMKLNGIKTKAIIEGPPNRLCPILLRQTAFTAIAERVTFKDNEHVIVDSHTARFGEIEQRGIALTPKGQKLYEQLIHQGNKESEHYDDELKIIFSTFPDTYATLREQQLAYFSYHINDSKLNLSTNKAVLKDKDLSSLVECGVVSYTPILYEDFLPVSAAGIFQSNLTTQDQTNNKKQGNQTLFEEYLGCAVLDPFTLYKEQQNKSIKHCLDYFT